MAPNGGNVWPDSLPELPSKARRDDGGVQNSSMQLVGVEWLSYINDHWFVKVESEGAMGGDNNGYMQILLGGGLRLPITLSTSIKLHAAAGPAGGGGADVGGGLLLDAGLGLQQKNQSSPGAGTISRRRNGPIAYV